MSHPVLVRAAWRRTPRRRLPVALCLAVAAGMGFVCPSPPTAETTRYRGRPLVRVLEMLRERGLHVIYSSAVVDERLVVTSEPVSADPRGILDEILPPLGLRAEEGPGGTLRIVPAREGVIRGRVISSARGSPLADATLTVVSTGVRVTAGPDGGFLLRDVPVGAQELLVEADGYTPRTTTIEVHARLSRDVLVGLEPRRNYIEEVVVTPGRIALVQQEQESPVSVTDQDLLMAPSFAGDVSRIVESLPGVAAPDNSAALNVRGSLPEDVSFIMDGLELYEPFHLRQFQSPFSHLDTGISGRVDFLGGPFTADFGDRHGGIIQVSTLVPDDAGRTFVSLGNINSQASHSGRLASGGAWWRASVRAWYPEAFRSTIEIGEPGLKPYFGDAYLNGAFVLSPHTMLTAHGLIAHERFEFQPSGEAQTLDTSSESGHFWLRVLHTWKPHVTSESVVSTGWIDRSRDGISDAEDDPVRVQDDRRTGFYGLKHDMTWRMSDSHLLKAGLDLRFLDAQYRYTTGSTSDPASGLTLRPEPSGTSSAAYVSGRVALTDGLAGEAGLRWDRQTHTGESQVSPRLHALWRPDDRSELRIGLGEYHQSQRIYELKIEDGETEFRPAERSRQAGLTFTRRYSTGLQFRLDAYYRTIDRLRPRYENVFTPLELFPETEPDRVLVDADSARLKGLELLLQAAPGARFYWRASYALSSAEDVIRGDGVPRNWDQTHAGAFLAGYRFGDSWFVSLAGSAHTGWPTTPFRTDVTVVPPDEPALEDVLGPRNAERFPDYLRFDLKASRSFLLRDAQLRLEVEILNLTDRKNACCLDDVEFEVLPSGEVEIDSAVGYWLGLTPTFRMIWEF